MEPRCDHPHGNKLRQSKFANCLCSTLKKVLPPCIFQGPIFTLGRKSRRSGLLKRLLPSPSIILKMSNMSGSPPNAADLSNTLLNQTYYVARFNGS